jgi:hypothetical protein
MAKDQFFYLFKDKHISLKVGSSQQWTGWYVATIQCTRQFSNLGQLIKKALMLPCMLQSDWSIDGALSATDFR